MQGERKQKVFNKTFNIKKCVSGSLIYTSPKIP